jgi:hypothetical protein
MLLHKMLFASDETPTMAGPSYYLGFDLEKSDFVIACVNGRGATLQQRIMPVPEFVKNASDATRQAFFETVTALLKQ